MRPAGVFLLFLAACGGPANLEANDAPRFFAVGASDADRYVAVGEEIAFSAGGEHWTRADVDVGGVLRGVAFHPSRVVAVGGAEAFVSEDDGVAWAPIVIGTPDLELVDVCCDVSAGLLALAKTPEGDTAAFHSNNGLDWTEPPVRMPIAQPRALSDDVYGFVVYDVGGRAVSIDGELTEVPVDEILTLHVTWDDGLRGFGRLDGEIVEFGWNARWNVGVPRSYPELRAIAPGGFAGVGPDGLYRDTAAQAFEGSDAWELVEISASWQAVHGWDKMIAVGDGIAFSPDGGDSWVLAD